MARTALMLFRSVLVGALMLCGLRRILRYWNRRRVIILMYHGFIHARDYGGVLNHERNHLSIDQFRAQIEYLSKHHCILPLKDYVRSRKKGEKTPDYSVILTFDDGYTSNHQLAFNVLKEFGAHATIFLATEFVEHRQPLWPDRVEWAISKTQVQPSTIAIAGRLHTIHLESQEARRESSLLLKQSIKALDGSQDKAAAEVENSLNERLDLNNTHPMFEPLQWEEVQEMLESGLVSIGNHSHSHPILSHLSAADQRREIESAHVLIQKNTGVRCRLFCYPNGRPGDFDDRTKNALRELGYECGLAVVPGANDDHTDLYELKRVPIHDGISMSNFVINMYGGLRGFLRDLCSILVRRHVADA